MKHYYISSSIAEKGFIEVTETEYHTLRGGDTVHPYASRVYRGEMTIEEVPEELREEVQTVVDRRIERLGKYEGSVLRRRATDETVG